MCVLKPERAGFQHQLSKSLAKKTLDCVLIYYLSGVNDFI